jgi:two-component system nitrogen regulation response regulator NtrX
MPFLSSNAHRRCAGRADSGEDGTGRQLAARAIHSAQNGAHGAFVAVNCAAFETEQLDVELFGGAARPHNGKDGPGGLERVSRQSRLHEAQGGTLYLQNLADASTRVQARLARVLRDREARLVETGETIGFDVRPMAGVEPGFEASVQDGRVREDLFRRVSAIALEMPPLRNRREDIPALVNYFVRQICASLGVPPKTLSRPALSLISALPWRGNAPEMRALIKNVVVGLQGGRGIGLDDVLVHVKLDAGSVVFANGGTLKEARARFERDYIAAILEQHHGRISDSARALGIQRTNLYRKMRSLRVHRDRRQ